MKLINQNAIITGANQGLGLAIAEKFIKEGASISICARNINKLRKAVSQLKLLARPDQQIFSKQVDVSAEKEVEKFIDFSIKKLKNIDILVNNAGIYGPKGCIEDVNSQEWLEAIQINLLGVFYVLKHTIVHMKNNNFGKIINLSGGGATSPLPRISAYAASKAAVVRLTETLAQECKDYNIDINAIAPGPLNTRLLDEILEVGPETVGEEFYKKAVKQKSTGGASLEKGADLCVYLASDKSKGISGKLISAVWDPWNSLERHKDDLDSSDIYTLRRIIPSDRKKRWG